MTDFLDRVVRERRADAVAARAWRPLERLVRDAQRSAIERGTLRLAEVVREHRDRGRLAVIAEVKRSSPALGRLAEIEEPGALARRYLHAGAAAISVLVEPRHWGGSLDDLRAVRSVERGIGYGGAFSVGASGAMGPTAGAILAKDVVVDEYQIAEAGAAGADAVLLIAEALTDAELARLIRYADGLGMDALVEAHEPAAFARAVASGAPIVGVNARDLREPGRIDRRRIYDLASELVTDQVLVAESGIASVEDVAVLPARVDAVLIGTALVRAADPAPLIRAIAGLERARSLA